jgi:hypothetical protein
MKPSFELSMLGGTLTQADSTCDVRSAAGDGRATSPAFAEVDCVTNLHASTYRARDSRALYPGSGLSEFDSTRHPSEFDSTRHPSASLQTSSFSSCPSIFASQLSVSVPPTVDACACILSYASVHSTRHSGTTNATASTIGMGEAEK